MNNKSNNKLHLTLSFTLILAIFIELIFRLFYSSGLDETPLERDYLLRASTKKILENKDESKYSVVILGDSFIYGWKIPEYKSIPVLTKNKLSPSISNIEVFNLSSPGANIFDYYLISQKLRGHRFNQIILNINSNDTFFLPSNANPLLVCPSLNNTKGNLLLSLISNSKFLYYVYSQVSIIPKVMELSEPLYSSCNKYYFDKLTDQLGLYSHKVITTYFWSQRFSKQLCTKINALSGNYLDQFSKVFKTKPDFFINQRAYNGSCENSSKLFFEDNYHLNEKGADAISDIFAEIILENYNRKQ